MSAGQTLNSKMQTNNFLLSLFFNKNPVSADWKNPAKIHG